MSDKTLFVAPLEQAKIYELIAQARRLQSGGKWDEAEAKLRTAISLAPESDSVHEALGLHEAKRGRLPQAIETLDRAVHLNPNSASAWNNLGAVAAQARNFVRAVEAFRAAVQLRPDWIDTRMNLGLACLQSNRFQDAVDVYQAAEMATPGRWDVSYRLSSALARLGQLNEAECEARRAIERAADSAEAHRHYGTILRRLQRPDEAVRSLQTAIKLQPGDPVLLGDHAIALHEAGRPYEAIRVFSEAIAITSDSADLRTNLGVALAEVGYLEEAVEAYSRAINLKPDSAEAHNNLGVTLVLLGRVDEALTHYDQAIALKPGYTDARTNRARALLALGRYEEGWREYEWRWRGDKVRPPIRNCPAWDGHPLSTGELLLTAEQGLGDTIMFARFAAVAATRAGVPVVFDCPAPLRPILARIPGVSRLVSPDDPSTEYTAHATLLSLPALLGLTDPSSYQFEGLHLTAEPARVDRWRSRVHELTAGATLRVGIGWQGNPRFKADRNRSIPLVHFAALAGISGVRLISLQKGSGEDQLTEWGEKLGVVRLGSDVDRDGAFLDTLAILSTLDLVVTSDTALAHLAGSAGIETWLVLPFAADWRWGKNRPTCPWYPTMRLFRQPTPGDWTTTFRNVAAALAERVGVEPPSAAAPDLVTGLVNDLTRKGREARLGGRPDEAVACLRKAFHLSSRDPEVTHELALALAARKDRFETELCFRRCLALRPTFAEVCNNLGILLEETGRAEEACTYFRRALEYRPLSAETHSNFGVALAARGEFEQALASYHESLRLKTDNPAALNNLGNALRNLGLPYQAVEALERAITVRPNYAEAHNNKGIALVLLGRVDEALSCYARALELKPDYAEAHLNRALSLLATGQYQEGWKEYEWRWQCNGLSPRHFPGRRWDGGEVKDGSLLLYVEQGLGDTIQFARLVPLVAKRAKAPVVLECQPPLVPLIRSFPGLDRVIPVGQPLPECAAHIPLMSLPGLLKLTDVDLPATRIPYLHAEPARVDRWRSRVHELTAGATLRVGIGWQGNPRFKADRNRSIPLVHFAALAGISGVRLISLQKGPGEDQLTQWGEKLDVVRLGSDVDRDGAFLDTLAILSTLDLVVTSDTALAHLAGSAGIETWLVLPFAADWRWGKNRPTCPWYPTMRLFRQPTPGDWATIFRQMGEELVARARTTPHERRDFPTEAATVLRQRGSAEIKAGRPAVAVDFFKQALKLQPGNPDQLHNLGVAWAKQGILPVAQAYFKEAIRINPGAAETHNNLGLSHLQQNRLAEAETCFRAALRSRPDHPDALNHLGVVFANQERWAEAAEWYRSAVRVRPDSAQALNNLGNALRWLRQSEEAVEHLRAATRLQADSADMWNNLGIALGQVGRMNEAVECFQKSLAIEPEHADALNNMGVTHADLGREIEGIAYLERAIRSKPDFPEAHKNLGLTRLMSGDLRGGWAEYEWRWRCRGNTPRSYPAPIWDGKPIADGGALLLYAEQGLGDTIQFVRLSQAASERANAPIILECQPPLLPLLSGFPGVQQVVAAGSSLPTFSAHAPLLSLPHLLGLSETDLPGIGFPYLVPTMDRVTSWKAQLAEQFPDTGLRVGIAWQGNPKYAGDRHRSVPLVYFTALHRVPGIHLMSLQKDVGTEQLERLPPWFPILPLDREADREGAFLDTLAILSALDLVVTCDTALAHLAGAAGIETWLLLPVAADWRWGRKRDDCRWYPKMRLFRQSTAGDWASVFQRVTRELESRTPVTHAVTAAIGHGEIFDKITILEIKAERIQDSNKRINVLRELAILQAGTPSPSEGSAEELNRLLARLKEVNTRLWEVEDDLRDCERAKRFDDRFIALARSVYHLNDERAVVKKAINALFHSPIVEEKSYASYSDGVPVV